MAEDQTPPDELTAELPIPGLELPEYHGRPAVGMKTSVNGTGNRITTPHEIGSRIVFVGEAIVKKAGHEEGDKGLLYVEGLNVKDLFEIQGPAGKRLLSAVRSAYRTATEGDLPLQVDPGDVVRTDASGVVITPGDAMSIEDDPLVQSLTNEAMTPVVIVYSDGARELWPDDYDAGDPRPAIGLEVLDEKEQKSYVAEILDATTGETLEVWTAEQQADRLLEQEHAAMLDEAKADREASEEIFASRGQTGADQVDPPEADGDGPGPDADPFPGIAGDAPDEELEVVETPIGSSPERSGPAQIEGPDGELVKDRAAPVDAAGLREAFGIPAGADPADVVEELPAIPVEAYQFVDRQIVDLKPLVAELTDRDEVLVYLRAEEDGRGRKLKPRSGVLELLTKRAEALFVADTPGAPDLPADPAAGFAPGANADEWED